MSILGCPECPFLNEKIHVDSLDVCTLGFIGQVCGEYIKEERYERIIGAYT